MKKILFILLPFLSNAQVKHSMQMDMPKNIIIQKTTPYNTPLKSLVSTVNSYKGKKVEYDLYVNDTIVNYTGKNRKAIAINGSIPAPTLEFTEGDTAIIHVHNRMHMETSIHWHGLLLPNKEDGVPYLTTSPVEAGETYTFTFPIIQSGTYWYHSHTMLQEQNGLYGSIVIHSAKPEPKLKEYVMLLSDWTDEKPEQALRYLKRGGEWYAIKKGSVTKLW
eukprot:Opistho-1_new@16719